MKHTLLLKTKTLTNLFQHFHRTTIKILIMKIKTIYTLILIWMLAITASAIPPSTFHLALKKLYPHATDAEWKQQGAYYIATFTQNGFLKKVWMDAAARWVMTDTDLQTTDQLTPSVYNDFTLSQYAMWTVNDVNLMEFPRHAPLYIITVNQDNSVSTYQLFYAMDGRLIQTRNVSYITPTLSPGVFDFQ